MNVILENEHEGIIRGLLGTTFMIKTGFYDGLANLIVDWIGLGGSLNTKMDGWEVHGAS